VMAVEDDAMVVETLSIAVVDLISQWVEVGVVGCSCFLMCRTSSVGRI
jgi:hypothetical protein